MSDPKEYNVHKTALMKALRSVLSHIPHRVGCATVILRFPRCTCDVGPRMEIAYSVVASLLLDLKKGTP